MLPPGAVLLSSRAPIGHVAVTTVSMATNQGFKSLIPDPMFLDSKYLFWWLRANKTYLQDLGVGATFKEVSKKIVSSVRIPLPPLPEQRRIASILDQADNLRVKRHQVVKTLEDLRLSTYQDCFQRVSGVGGGWPAFRIDEIATTRLGKMLDARQQTGMNSWPYLRNANVQWMRFDLDNLLQMDFTPKERVEFSLQTGDVMVCEGGEPGRSAIWNGQAEDVYFQKALHRVRLDQTKVTPEYFVWTMRYMVDRGQLADFITSATIAHLTGEKLKSVEIKVPPLDLQRRFQTAVQEIGLLLEKHRQHLAKLDELFASLQHRAFRGEL